MSLTTTKGEDLVQIITDDCEFNSNFDAITAGWGFKELEFDYKILSVLGSQSSGKSTLLNHLFNTGFAVLDASSGIHQTTLGIWASPGDTKNILVLDVEGTDSKERGEENTAFEKKTSLFSLALSEILIINVNAKDIGCLKASNFSLLKFVLELNLQLFARNKTSKTLLLFTVRDWCSDTPQEVIKNQLGGDMKIIWAEISKPNEFATSPMSQFFDVDFQLFSHYKYEKSKFLDQAKDLRDKLTNSSHPDYLWNPIYITDVPADGFDCYAKNIWEVVKENRDLDLPSQKAMLALFRCGEISDQIYTEFVEKIKPTKLQIKNNQFPEDFGSSLSEIVAASMESYNKPASRYHAETAEAKGKELLDKMKKDLFAVYLEYLSKLRAQVVDQFDKNVEAVIPDNENEILPNFATIMAGLKEKSLAEFDTRSKGAAITQAEGEWSAENDSFELDQTLTNRIAVVREDQMRRMVDKLEKNVKVKIVEPLQDVLEAPTPDMWEKIRTIEVKGKERTVTMLDKELTSFACSDEIKTKKVQGLEKRVRGIMEETIKKNVDNLYDNIMKIFRSKFENCNGLPRKWGKEDDVEEIYTSCKEDVLGLVDLFSINRIDEENAEISFDDEEDIPSELLLMSKREAAQLKTRFLQTSDVMFSKARTDQERNNAVTQIPGFMFILLLLFAFDEILWILSNPILFMLSFVILAIAGILWYLNLLQFVLGMIMDTASTTGNQLLQHAATAVPPKEKAKKE